MNIFYLKKSLKFTIVVVIVIAISAALFLISGKRKFETNAWLNQSLIQEGVRLEMVDDIFDRKLLDGKSRSEVITLLGQPPETGYFHDWHFVYWLGPERSLFSIDSEWLVVRFGKSERVEKYKIIRD